MRRSGNWTITTTRDFGPPETERASGEVAAGREHTLRLQIESGSSALVFFIDGKQVARLEYQVR